MRFTKEMMITAFLEVYALILANMQAIGGVRTDEAKYLLNIPYPHPPLMRGIVHAFEWLPFQEMFWRVIFATLLVQAVWLVWKMGKELATTERFAVVFTWLFSAAMVMQSGTIMMAPVTVLEALLFLWILGRVSEPKRTIGQRVTLWLAEHVPFLGKHKEADPEWLAFGVGTLWLASLLTAYQIVLFTPIVIAIFWKLPAPRWQKWIYFFGPIIVVGIYTLGHPLSLASFVLQGKKDASQTILERSFGTFMLWLVAGSVMGSLAGTFGIFRSKSPALIISFLLVVLSLWGARYDYYATLFVPLLVAGCISLFSTVKLESFPYVPCLVGAMLVIVGLSPPWFVAPRTRQIVQAIEATKKSGDILVIGSFGHDWQYESRVPIHTYTPELLDQAAAVVCNSSCEGIRLTGFHLLQGLKYEVWIRR